MNMRPSRVLAKLRKGQVASCVKLNFADARAAELAAMCGFDCIWADLEHCANDWTVVEQQIWAAKSQDVDVMTRVSRGGYSDYIRPLELDSAGIMVPHIMSLEDAKRVVHMTRFHPIGRRPIDGGNADGAYTMVDVHDYIKQANEQRFIGIQIEDPEPLDELEEIAALDGIDMLFFGPADFSQGIGAPGQWDNPMIAETRKRVAEVAIKHGKIAGTVGNPGNLAQLVDMGYRFVNIGADVVGLIDYFKGLVRDFNAIAAGTGD